MVVLMLAGFNQGFNYHGAGRGWISSLLNHQRNALHLRRCGIVELDLLKWHPGPCLKVQQASTLHGTACTAIWDTHAQQDNALSALTIPEQAAAVSLAGRHKQQYGMTLVH